MVALAAPRWAPARRSLSQLVEVRPDITIESPTIAPVINLEMGGLPLSIGLGMGSALTFLIRTALPQGWPQTVALVAGSGLAVAAVVNMVMPKAEAAPAGPPPPGAPRPPGVAPVPLEPGAVTRPYVPSTVAAFENVTGRIASPADFATIDIGWFATSYPVRVQLHNPSSVPVTFELELVAEEEPAPVGSPALSTLPVQVSMGPGEVKNVDVAMPIATWDTLVDYAEIILTARKRRAPGESAQRLDFKSFVVE